MQGYQYSAMSMTPQAMRNLHKSDVYKPKRAKFWPFQNCNFWQNFRKI